MHVIVNKVIQEHNQIVVDASIVEDDGSVLDNRKFGHSLDTPQEEILTELRGYLTTYRSDLEVAEQSKEAEAKQQLANETIAALENVTIREDAPVVDPVEQTVAPAVEQPVEEVPTAATLENLVIPEGQ